MTVKTPEERAADLTYHWIIVGRDADYSELDYGSVGLLSPDITVAHVVAQPTRDGLPAHIVTVPGGAEVVVFRRNKIHLPQNDDGSLGAAVHERILVIGWRCGEQRAYAWIHDDGSVAVTPVDDEA